MWHVNELWHYEYKGMATDPAWAHGCTCHYYVRQLQHRYLNKRARDSAFVPNRLQHRLIYSHYFYLLDIVFFPPPPNIAATTAHPPHLCTAVYVYTQKTLSVVTIHDLLEGTLDESARSQMLPLNAKNNHCPSSIFHPWKVQLLSKTQSGTRGKSDCCRRWRRSLDWPCRPRSCRRSWWSWRPWRAAGSTWGGPPCTPRPAPWLGTWFCRVARWQIWAGPARVSAGWCCASPLCDRIYWSTWHLGQSSFLCVEVANKTTKKPKTIKMLVFNRVTSQGGGPVPLP